MRKVRQVKSSKIEEGTTYQFLLLHLPNWLILYCTTHLPSQFFSSSLLLFSVAVLFFFSLSPLRPIFSLLFFYSSFRKMLSLRSLPRRPTLPWQTSLLPAVSPQIRSQYKLSRPTSSTSLSLPDDPVKDRASGYLLYDFFLEYFIASASTSTSLLTPPSKFQD